MRPPADFISALGRRFNLRWFSLKQALVCAALLLMTSYGAVAAELVDRVVIVVDNECVTLAEFEKTYEEARRRSIDITRRELLDTEVNRLLMLRQSRSMKLGGANEDEIIERYIDLKVRSLIVIKNESIDAFSRDNRRGFPADSPIEDVRDKIETYLIEEEVNKRLNVLIEGLREKSYIKIQLE